MFSKKMRAVIRHEYLTVVKQPTFVLIMLALPLAMAAIIAVSYFSSKTSESSIQEAAKKVDNVAIIDKSGIVAPHFKATNNLQLRPADTEKAVINEVKAGKLDGAIVYPSDLLSTKRFDIYVGTNDFTQSSSVSSLGEEVLKASVFAPLGSAKVITLAQQGASARITSYKDGVATAGYKEFVVPGVFLVLFFIIMVFSINYMLSSVAEEKENRSMEMVLSYVKPRTLILGKLFGISLVALTQLAFFSAVAAIGYLVARQFSDSLTLPFDLNLSGLPFNISAIVMGLTTLVLGFLLFSALMAGVGSMVPSVKDAGPLTAIFMIGAIIPFYAINLIATSPSSPVTQFMTYFPTTAPTTMLVRNAVDNLNGGQAVLALAALLLYTLVSFVLAGKLFRLGALEYSNRLNLATLLKK